MDTIIREEEYDQLVNYSSAGWVSNAGRYIFVVMRFKRGVITEQELDNC
jgi:hypothetical protein